MLPDGAFLLAPCWYLAMMSSNEALLTTRFSLRLSSFGFFSIFLNLNSFFGVEVRALEEEEVRRAAAARRRGCIAVS